MWLTRTGHDRTLEALSSKVSVRRGRGCVKLHHKRPSATVRFQPSQGENVSENLERHVSCFSILSREFIFLVPRGMLDTLNRSSLIHIHRADTF